MTIVTTIVSDWAKVRATNSTDAAFPARPDTVTEPTGDGVVGATFHGSMSYGRLLLKPYALGDDNGTFNMRVLGWNEVAGQWTYVIMAEVACTCCAAVGLALGSPLNTERYVDTLVLTYGNAASAEVVSPVNDLPGHLILDAKGSQRLEVLFDIGANVTSMNALYRRF